MPLPIADATATAALVVAVIALALMAGTIALVLWIRSDVDRARRDAKADLELLRRELGAGHRPMLVDVLPSVPMPTDMDASGSIELPGIGRRQFDPRSVFVSIEGGKVYLSVPLRNVGSGLAMIDAGGVGIRGAGLGTLEHRTIQRDHVPVNETTRIDLITGYRMEELDNVPGASWQLTVPYTDFAGEQRTVARLQIVCRGRVAQEPWSVERVEQLSRADRPAPPQIGAVTPVEPEPPAAPPEEESSVPSRQSREQVTDIWGQPLTQRRRRR